MKTNFKIFFKCIGIIFFLSITPFFHGMIQTFQLKNINFFHYNIHHNSNELVQSVKKNLNVLTYNSNVNINYEKINFETTTDINEVKEPMVLPKRDKRVYIYSTHQKENYLDGETVMDAAVELGKTLETYGIEVVLETNDFTQYAKSNNISYDKFYNISNKFIADAFATYGHFDSIIDLHRDSIPRNSTFITNAGIDYAKMMFVVGGLSKNVNAVTANSTTLTDIINKKVYGIMRTVMTKQSYYNQFMNEKMVLIELGSNNNTFKEVKNSIDYLAKGISEMIGVKS